MTPLEVFLGLQNIGDDVKGHENNMTEEEGADKWVMVQGFILPESW